MYTEYTKRSLNMSKDVQKLLKMEYTVCVTEKDKKHHSRKGVFSNICEIGVSEGFKCHPFRKRDWNHDNFHLSYLHVLLWKKVETIWDPKYTYFEQYGRVRKISFIMINHDCTYKMNFNLLEVPRNIWLRRIIRFHLFCVGCPFSGPHGQHIIDVMYGRLMFTVNSSQYMPMNNAHKLIFCDGLYRRRGGVQIFLMMMGAIEVRELAAEVASLLYRVF